MRYHPGKLAVLLAFICATLLSACDKNQPKGQSAATEKEYLVGTDAAYAPFESMTNTNDVVGFDVDLIKAIAEKEGIKIKLINTPWEGIFKTLEQGDRDLLISCITITDERKMSMDFSEPYFEAKQLIAVGKDSAIAKFEDLKDKKVGVQTGTTGDEIVQKLQGKSSENLVRFEFTPLALKELEAGGVDAVVADNGVVANYVKNNSDKGFRVVDDPSFATEYYGIAVKKGNTELLTKLNEGL
ncbi:MAG TPA: basic amino acid ABC transporter substrate-binding protein, partial [Pseudomonadales bacterium]|nr:basic amino acid ABC transporter substrate-binding protein [Pseudomonadales bacterium]